MSNYTPQSIFIRVESTLNPHALKFSVNKTLIPQGISFDFATVHSTINAPLARELFTYAFVTHVFYMDNFISITKKKSVEWKTIQGTLQIHIKNFIESGHTIINQSVLLTQQKKQDSRIIEKIKSIFNEHIKPAVQQDGGTINFHSYANGVVTVTLHGACHGCPASTTTLKNGVENLLKKMIPNKLISVEVIS